MKLGTSLDRTLVQRAQTLAAERGLKLNVVLEDALSRYLSAEESSSGRDIVEATWGAFKIDRRTLRKVMDEDIYDA